MTARDAVSAALAGADLSIKSIIVLGLAWVIAMLLKKGSAATRHLVWLTAFSALLLLPLLSAVVPAHRIAVYQEAAAPNNVPKPVAAGWLVPANEALRRFKMGTQRDPGAQVQTILRLQNLRKSGVPSTAKFNATSSVGRGQSVIEKVLKVTAMCLWLAGVIVVAIQGLCGLLSLRRIQSIAIKGDVLGANPIDWSRLSQRVGLKRGWDLRISQSPQPPAAMTWGFFRPVILLPQDSMTWTQERFEAVLLHELAHVRRLDSLSQLIAAAASALYWFNPAVWLCARAMRAEAETAADDTVICAGIKPSVYARELLLIAADLGHRRQPFSSIGVPVMKQSKIELRVQAILNPSTRRRRGVTLIEALVTACIAVAVIAPISAVRAAAVPHATEGKAQQKKPPSNSQSKDQSGDKATAAERQKLIAEMKALEEQASVLRKQLTLAKTQLAAAKSSLEAQRRALADLKKAQAKAQPTAQDPSKIRQLLEKELAEVQRQVQEVQKDELRKTIDQKVQLIDATKRVEVARIQLAEAKQEAVRMKSLFDEGLVHNQDCDAAAAKVKIAEAELKAAQALFDAVKKK